MELIIRSTAADLPIWGSSGTIRQLFGVSENALARLVEAGSVRTRKLPGGRAAGRIYKIQGKRSLVNYLEGAEEVGGDESDADFADGE